jgi:hypothetical protein
MRSQDTSAASLITLWFILEAISIPIITLTTTHTSSAVILTYLATKLIAVSIWAYDRKRFLRIIDQRTPPEGLKSWCYTIMHQPDDLTALSIGTRVELYTSPFQHIVFHFSTTIRVYVVRRDYTQSITLEHIDVDNHVRIPILDVAGDMDEPGQVVISDYDLFRLGSADYRHCLHCVLELLPGLEDKICEAANTRKDSERLIELIRAREWEAEHALGT